MEARSQTRGQYAAVHLRSGGDNISCRYVNLDKIKGMIRRSKHFGWVADYRSIAGNETTTFS